MIESPLDLGAVDRVAVVDHQYFVDVLDIAADRFQRRVDQRVLEHLLVQMVDQFSGTSTVTRLLGSLEHFKFVTDAIEVVVFDKTGEPCSAGRYLHRLWSDHACNTRCLIGLPTPRYHEILCSVQCSESSPCSGFSGRVPLLATTIRILLYGILRLPPPVFELNSRELSR